MTNLKSSNENTSIRVLHVDDDQSIREITKLMLMDLSSAFEIDQACSVDDGFKKLAMDTYDVVVSDYEMPNKNGLEFLKELREQNNQIPFILFTGKGREEVAIKALNLGADGYYNKQGSPETVYGELAHGIQTSFRQKKADELLRKSQAELKAIVNNSPIGIATSDSNSKFRSANEAFCRIVGYSEDELQKRSFRDITYIDDVEISNMKMKELICGNILFFKQDKRYVRKDGSIIDGKVTVSAIRNNEGKPVLYVAELEDITQDKQAEAELRRTFDVLERVGEGIGAGLAVIGKDYRVIWANKILMDLGVSPNKKCYQTFNHSEFVCADCGVKKIFEQNASLDVHEYKTVNVNGETIWIELRVTPLKDRNGNITAALELAVPITEHKNAELALALSEKTLRAYLEFSPISVFVADNDGKYAYVNNAACKMLGYSREELLNMTVSQIVPEEDANRRYRFNELKEKGYFAEEMRLRKKNGTIIEVSLNSSKLPDGKLVAYCENISERKKTEEKLTETLIEEKFLADLVRNASVAVAVGYPDGRVDNFNLAFEKLTGYTQKELTKITWNNVLTPPEWMPAEKAKLEELERTRKPVSYEKEYIRKDGSRVLIELSVHPVFDENGKITRYYAFINDISQRKRVESELRQSEAQFRQLFSNMPNAVVVYEAVDEGKDFVFKDFNATAERIENLKKAEVIGKRVEEVFPGVESFGVLEVFQRVWQSGEPEYYPANIYRDENDPGSWRENWVYKLPNGNIVAIYNDITERKQAEKKLEETMNQLVLINEKLGVVGSLTRHDVGNKLMVAKSNLFLLKKKIGDNPDLERYIERIDSALASSGGIFEFSRLYEQIGVEKPTTENVFDCFNQAVALFPELSTIKVVNECQRLAVVADSLLKRLFYNLIDNSLKHGQKVTQIQLQYTKDIDGVKLIYRDNGIGVPETNKSKLFQVGFSTGKSSGLGLFLIKKLADVYGWRIVEEGQPNKGVKFVISIALSSVVSF